MICAWDKLLRILPLWMRDDVDRMGKEELQELRLRLDRPPLLCMQSKKVTLKGNVTQEDLSYIVNTASRYSPWTAQSIAKGYLTAPGGHRIGLCGDAVLKNDMLAGIQKVSSLNIRVARDFPGYSGRIRELSDSILLIGPPGSGKTTLLRDLIRRKSGEKNVAVVDERGELFPEGCFSTGEGLDVLTGCPKAQGIEMLLRTMGPEWIGVDEITAPGDCDALVQAGWCGIKLMATAHAMNLQDLRSRPIYRPILNSGLFPNICVLRSNKTYRMERLLPC